MNGLQLNRSCRQDLLIHEGSIIKSRSRVENLWLTQSEGARDLALLRLELFGRASKPLELLGAFLSFICGSDFILGRSSADVEDKAKLILSRYRRAI